MKFHIHKRYVALAVIALVVILAFLSAALVHTYREVAPREASAPLRLSRLRETQLLGPSDIGTIASWMTFDYINHVFGLPADYLRSELGISDARYPELSLARYAKDQAQSADALTGEVQTAVQSYFASRSVQ